MIWALFAAGFTALTLLRLRAPKALPRGLKPVLVLRPADALSAPELASLGAAVVSVRPVRQVLISPARPDGVWDWIESDPATLNRKVGHIRAALNAIDTSGAHVLVIDSDVEVDAVLIEALASALEQGADIVSAEPRLQRAQTLADHALAGVWNASHHNFGALFAMSVGPKTICGKALGLSPRALPWLREDVIGEDLELAKTAFSHCARIEHASAPAMVPASRASVAQVHARLVRWMCVLRSHRPALVPTVPILFCPFLLLLLVAPIHSLVVFVCLRTLLGARLDGWRGALRWPLAEVLLLSAFLTSLFTREVSWRGHVIRVAS